VLAERTLEVVMALCNGRAGAIFKKDGKGITLHTSRGIDQKVLDAVETVWARHKDVLAKGEAFYVPDRLADRRLPKEQRESGVASFVVVPVFAADELLALLYVDSHDPHFCEPHDLERLTKLSRIVAKAVAGSDGSPAEPAESVWRNYLERTPLEDMEREKLLLLLNRNEWNISRVARLMEVTRRTIYMRLARHKIPREKVPKTRRRLAPV
jgi:transcriptional regulator with GAF, ATPase, and Fis domain